MSSATVLPANPLFSKHFWSVDETAHDLLFKKNEKSTRTLNSLSTFYKEFSTLEAEYSRKLDSLINRLDLPKHESVGTLKTTIDVFQEQCLKISESHSLQSRRIQESLCIPLNELINERKAREKSIKAKVEKAWLTLLDLKSKCDSKSIKFEKNCIEMKSLKSTRLTLDNRELEKLEEKISALKSKMLLYREDNWEYVEKYNNHLQDWISLWYESCNELQVIEEARIGFLKSNLWEFANLASMFSVENDQYAENIRINLKECSATKDIMYFVESYKTGDEILTPLKFIDFAKNESRPLHEEPTKKFDISEFSNLNARVNEQKAQQHESLKKKRNPPPQNSETTDIAFSLIDRSKETFKKLQEEAQKDASQIKLNKLTTEEENSGSEPSTFKVMSDYSNPTTRTSISSHSFNNDFQSDINPVTFNKQQNKDLAFSDEEDALETNTNTLNSNVFPSESKKEKNIFQNNNIFRESMSPAKENKEENNNEFNGFANLAGKSSYNSPTKSSESKAFLTSSPESEKVQFKQLFSASPVFANGDKHRGRTSLMLVNSKRRSSLGKKSSATTICKSKSQYNLKDRHISVNELPSHSSEGYPVIGYCKAKYNYAADMDLELSFKKKDVLLILHKQPDDWWFAENLNSKDSGLVPRNYLTTI